MLYEIFTSYRNWPKLLQADELGLAYQGRIFDFLRSSTALITTSLQKRMNSECGMSPFSSLVYELDNLKTGSGMASKHPMVARRANFLFAGSPLGVTGCIVIGPKQLRIYR